MASDEDGADIFGEVHRNNQASWATISWVSLRSGFPEQHSNILNGHNSQIPSRLATVRNVKTVSIKWIHQCSQQSHICCPLHWERIELSCECHLLYLKILLSRQSMHACGRNQQPLPANPDALQNGQILDFNRVKNVSNVVIHWKSYVDHVHSNLVSKSGLLRLKLFS